MSEYFRKIIKKDHYPLPYCDIKFKTYFTNCIPETMQARGYKQTEDDDWNIYWCEKEFISQTLDKIRLFPEKRINHYRNFYEICRKDLLSKNVKQYKKTLQREGKSEEAAGYDFIPLTYNLPSMYSIFAEEFKRCKEQKSVWIMKPIGRSQGKGIFLFRQIGDISDWADSSNQPEPYIVQRYIHNPLLIGHKKFDMRLYVLVTSHNPLTVYLYRSGFGRFTHYRYDLSDIYNNQMHLTNVAVQKNTDNYDEERGGKYLLDKLRLFILSKYGDQATEKSFFQIQELVIKTLLATSRIISNDKRCFQLYGFDVMLDANLKPWLIEINGSPSMTANTALDRKLKNGLLDDTLTIVNLEKILTGEEEQIGGFDLIYRNNKRVKNGMKNISFLGCLNNRMQQMPKMAKQVALKLAEKAREERAAQEKQQRNQPNQRNQRNQTNQPNQRTQINQRNQVNQPNQQNNRNQPTQQNKNIRNKSTNIPSSNHHLYKEYSDNDSNETGINRNNIVKRPPEGGMVKLPKVSTIGNSSVSNTSMKAIWEGGGKRSGHEGGSREERRK